MTDPSPILMIAEMGVNHQGSVEIARALIDAAAYHGADAVKAQKREPRECVPEDQWQISKDAPWGKTVPYIEYRERMEFSQAEWKDLHEHAAMRGVPLFFSVFDEPSLAFVQEFDAPWVKIPSCMLTDYHLVRKAAESGRHVILSTGMSTMEEVKVAATILRQNAREYTLMHCHSAYPAPRDELNLRCIRTLKDTFLCPVGYSGHEPGTHATEWAAAILGLLMEEGVSMIERHLTLAKSMAGSDHQSSLEPMEFAGLVANVRSLERALGDGVKRLWDSERPAMEKLRPKMEAA